MLQCCSIYKKLWEFSSFFSFFSFFFVLKGTQCFVAPLVELVLQTTAGYLPFVASHVTHQKLSALGGASSRVTRSFERSQKYCLL